jgi:broad specificity phosphatase PhoE
MIMRIAVYALTVAAFLVAAPPSRADNEIIGEAFSIFLVRHAEKDQSSESDDPGLSVCGESRAQSIAAMLADVDLDKVYSTDYRRTRDTARPIAAAQQLEVSAYDPRELDDFAALLLKGKEDALVVGHSNTTGVLAGILAGEGGEAFDEGLYDRLYQVVIAGGQRRAYLLHQAFTCRL